MDRRPAPQMRRGQLAPSIHPAHGTQQVESAEPAARGQDDRTRTHDRARPIRYRTGQAAGTWQLLPDEQRWAVPGDLQEQLDGNDAARTNFENFPPSSRRLILEWIAIAKRPGTRRRRIDQTVNLAALNIRTGHPRNTPVCPTPRHRAT